MADNPKIVETTEKGVFFVETHSGFVSEPTGFPRRFTLKQAEEFVAKLKGEKHAVQQTKPR